MRQDCVIIAYNWRIIGGYKLIWKYFGQIPVPKINEDQEDLIGKIVDKILSFKKFNPFADIRTLEKEIDRLVYELYGSAEEEIKINRG